MRAINLVTGTKEHYNFNLKPIIDLIRRVLENFWREKITISNISQ